ncbi:hypothetical protein [Microcoleus sp. OTE_8_concoct_300]|uniref:hypothetical protein n=1 Tax=Microcoleus sp. OTE_8_concoct_300 TaxID=2964710 RepID=UPI00403F1B34
MFFISFDTPNSENWRNTLIVHPPILDGFTLKTATLVKKADGWYTGISTENRTVPTPMTVDTIKTAVGIDVGLEKFLGDSRRRNCPDSTNL